MKIASIRDAFRALVLVTIFGASLGLSIALSCELRTYSQCLLSLLAIASLAVLLAGVGFGQLEKMSARKVIQALWLVAIPISCVHLCFCWCLYKANEISLATLFSMSQTAKWNLQRKIYGTYFVVWDATKLAVADQNYNEAAAFVSTEIGKLGPFESAAYEHNLNLLYRSERWPELPRLGVGAETLARTLLASSEVNTDCYFGALYALQAVFLSNDNLYEADFVTECIRIAGEKRGGDTHIAGRPSVPDKETIVEAGYLSWLVSRIDDQRALDSLNLPALLKYPGRSVQSPAFGTDDWKQEAVSWNHCISKSEFKRLLELARASLKDSLVGVSMFPSNTPELLATLDRLKQVSKRMRRHGRYVAGAPITFESEQIGFLDAVQGRAGAAMLPLTNAFPALGPQRPVLIGSASVQGATNGGVVSVFAAAGPVMLGAPVLQGAQPAVQSVFQSETPVLQGAPNANLQGATLQLETNEDAIPMMQGSATPDFSWNASH